MMSKSMYLCVVSPRKSCDYVDHRFSGATIKSFKCVKQRLLGFVGYGMTCAQWFHDSVA